MGRRGGVLQFANQFLGRGQVGHMGQADHSHLCRHHRIGCGGDFLQRFEQHLPHARQYSHRQARCHILSTGPLIRADGRIFCRIGSDLHHRHPMGDLGQIAQHRHRVRALGILTGQLREGRRRIAAQDHIHQIQHPAPVRKTEHRAHLIRCGLPSTMADCLIQQ